MTDHRINPRWKPPPDVRLRIARGDAIEAYSELEFSLARLFALLLGSKPALAGIVFYRLGNARARNASIETLIKRKHGSEFNPYWNSILRLLGQVDGRRNETVHWGRRFQLNTDRTQKRNFTSATVYLAPPNIWDRASRKAKLTERDLTEFVSKCDFLGAAVWLFTHYSVMRGRGSRARRAELRRAFHQALTFPPPGDHPIRRLWPKAQIAVVLRGRRR